jgi:tetratricopeptide (TPR) repeat protein
MNIKFIVEFPETIKKAQKALEEKDYQSAKRLFDKITEDKRLKESVYVLAESYYAKGLIAALDIQWAKAAENFERAAQLKPSIRNLLQASEYLNRVGRYQKAETLAREALTLSIKEHGEEHTDTARSYNHVATNLYAQGDYKKAQPLLEKALKIHINTLGEEHPSTATQALEKKDYQTAKNLLDCGMRNIE